MKKLTLSFFIILTAVNLFSINENRITILDFTTSGVSKSEMLLLVDYIAGEIPGNSTYKLIDRRQRDKILDELKFSASGCTDEGCQLEIGKLLSANFIIVGSLGSIGSVYILNMQLIEVETGETIRTTSNKYADLDKLVNDSTNLIISLLDKKVQSEKTMQPGESTAAPRPAASATAAEIPKPLKSEITNRPGLFGPIYNYNSKNYFPKQYPDLAKKLFNTSPENSDFQKYYKEYDLHKRLSSCFGWGGLAVLVGGYATAVVGASIASDQIAITGGIVGGLGIISEIISAVYSGSSKNKLKQLVGLYNNRRNL